MGRSPIQTSEDLLKCDAMAYMQFFLKDLGYSCVIDSVEEYKDRFFQKHVVSRDGKLCAELYCAYKNAKDLSRITVRYFPDEVIHSFEEEFAQLNVAVAKVGASVELIPRERVMTASEKLDDIVRKYKGHEFPVEEDVMNTPQGRRVVVYESND